MGTAEGLGTGLCFLSTAAQCVPPLQTVDGFSTAAEVADTRAREEAGWVSGPALTVMANGSKILSCGTGRWERNVRFVESVLCKNKATLMLTSLEFEVHVKL